MTRHLVVSVAVLVLVSACATPLIHPEAVSEPTPSAEVAPATEPASSAEVAASAEAPASAGETVTLAWGETARLQDAGLDVTFESIFSDGRCPTNITCAATLPVTVNLTIDPVGDGEPGHLNLSAHTDKAGAVIPDAPGVLPADRYGSVLVALQSVTPYPDYNVTTNPEDYRVSLLVTPVEGEPEPAAADGQPFDLKRGETVEVAGSDLTMRLRRVEDTRCPLELDCVQGGRVDVSISVASTSAGDTVIHLVAPTGPTGRVPEAASTAGSEAGYAGYTIALQQVIPYPQTSDEIPQKDYRVTLTVTPLATTPPAPPHTRRTGAPSPGGPPGGGTTLKLGETHTFDDGALRVTFDAVNEDSRCPLDVNCFWSGVVDVQLTAAVEGQQPQSFEVGGAGDSDGTIRGPIVEASGPSSWDYAGYTIDLKKVLPYPAHASETTPDAEYSVVIDVSRRQ